MSRWRRQETGAVLIMALFAGVLLIGLLYHVTGVGRSALEQQTMQDAADATAFTAATVNARGMNIIALLNLIMVAVLTILVALRLVESLVTVALTAVSVCCAVPGYGAVCCGLEAPLALVEEKVTTVADEYQEIAVELLKGLNSASDAVNEIVPVIALAEGAAVASSEPYSPPSDFGVVYPFFNGLPTVEGSYGELCKRAGENVATPMQYTVPSPELGELLTDLLGDLIGELTETFSSYYCGDDGSGGNPEKPEAISIAGEESDTEVAAQGTPIAESDEDKKDMAPRVLDEDRYADESVLTSILTGERRAANRVSGVAMATWGRNNGSQGTVRFGFAAAEYYSKNNNDESMWHMKWLSRLVRFPLESSSGGSGSTGAESTGYSQDIEDNNQTGQSLMAEANEETATRFEIGGGIGDFVLH
jgi:hypothetical protein